MAVDFIIRPARGASLGDSDAVRRILAGAFPRIKFVRLPSGADKIKTAAMRRIELDPALKERLVSLPAKEGANFEGQGFSVEISWEDGKAIPALDGVAHFRGTDQRMLSEHLGRLNGCSTELQGAGAVVPGDG